MHTSSNVPSSEAGERVLIISTYTNKYPVCLLVEEEAYAQVRNNDVPLS